MVDSTNIKTHTITRPDTHTLFGNGAQFDALPATHQAQILFLNETASAFVWQYSADAHLVTGGLWAPFEQNNFKEVTVFDDFSQQEASWQSLKKWLYNRGIAFDNWVYMLEEGNQQAILLTWKMVIKYAADLFIMSDLMFFDNTLNWCLFYFHEGKLFFGKDNVFDTTASEQEMEALNKRKQQYPGFQHPYL